MPYINKAQYQDYMQFCKDRNHGKLFTLNVLRLICSAHDYNAEKIGKYFLQLLSQTHTEEL